LTAAQAALRSRLANGDGVTSTTHQIAQIIRFSGGGRNEFLGFVRRAALNHDADAVEWWKVFSDLLPVHQARVNLDDVCEASGITPDKLMAIVVSTAMRAGVDAAEYYAATTHPQVVRQTVKSSLRIAGKHAAIAQKDREFVLQHHKFIPPPGRGGIFVNANANAAAAASAQSQPSVPSFADSLGGAMEAHKTIQGELIDGLGDE